MDHVGSGTILYCEKLVQQQYKLRFIIMSNFKILEIFKSLPFYSICSLNVNLLTYDKSTTYFTDTVMSHGNIKLNSSSIAFAAHLYTYIAFTAILSSSASLDFLRAVSLPIRLPIFNIMLLKNVSGNVRLFSKSTGNVFGCCKVTGIQEFVNHCLSLTESDLSSLCSSKYFGLVLVSSSDKTRFLHHLKLIINNCFQFDSFGNISFIDYSRIAYAIEFSSRVIDNWETDSFTPDVGDSNHLNIHRFRGDSGHFICDFAGFSALSSDKISLFVCFLSIFDVSFTSSSDGINFAPNSTSPLPGDSSFYIQDIHYLLVWSSVFSFSKAIPQKDSSRGKQEVETVVTPKVTTSETATTKVGKAKIPTLPISKAFSTHSGFTPVEFVYVNKLLMVPYISDCGSKILFANPEWDSNKTKLLYKMFP